MKSAIQQGKGKLVIEDKPTPEPGPGQVLIKIAYCGICGSDLHYFNHDQAPSGNVLGHEWSGTIAEVGEGVDNFKKDDLVTMADIPGWLVPELPPDTPIDMAALLKMHPVAYAGGFSEYLLYYAHAVHHIPEGVSLEEAALTDTLGVGLEAVNRVQLKVGATVLIIGAGPIGLSTLMAARVAGAGRIIVTEMAEARKAAAKKFGADFVLDPKVVDVAQEVTALTGWAGADIVFESAGVQATIQQSVDMVKRSGQVVLVGVCFEPAEILPYFWFMKDVRVNVVPGADLVSSLNVMARKMVDVKPLVTHIERLEDIQETFEALLHPTDQLKVLIKP
ncbi:MAG: zinc-binding dehydrogenase [Deltaproteobacteria bacterium]|nr:zinc-binding dehydrogenase [Deltaproteobacteria bacterium]MBW2051481.1 zinc-binding dehydrogenase [Deltaproteobacteria bacterium]MBW2140591.1 zinc-binding dehydrogenase [Deltaproteobacteria bacterium]MBW2324284.1 zinc-binding dehydrogenase [Deltaproteobacteria bacterium]